MTLSDPRLAQAPLPSEVDDGPPRWMLALERAHALALRAGRRLEAAPSTHADLRPAAAAIEAALGALYGAFDLREDRLDATQRAQAELDRAGEALRATDLGGEMDDAALALGEARAALAVAVERFSRVPPEVAPDVPELRASSGVPSLHHVARASLVSFVPMLRLPPPLPPPPEALPSLPPPTSLEELGRTMAEVKRRAEERRRDRETREVEQKRVRAEAAAAASAEEDEEPPPGFARGRFTAMSSADFLAARTRECFEEVAMVGSLRAPLLGDPWRFAAVLERRLLCAVDALAALGPRALGRLEPLLLDAPAKDPSRGFAIAMVLGCVEGRDALGAVERSLHHLGPADPEVASQVGGALKLIPHPALPFAARALLAEPDPALRALAIDVLAYRGLATLPELLAAARDPSPLVAAAALPALGLLRPPDLRPLVDAARQHPEPAMREAAWTAMALSGDPDAAEVVAAELAGPLGSRAAVPLAIVGDERDASRLLEAARQAPTSMLIMGVGWAGSPEAVPLLIDLLGHADPVIQLSAAYALDRITGAKMYEDVEVPPETIDVPDVDEPDVGEPRPARLSMAISDPRDRPGEGANDRVTLPTVRADRWRAYWIEKGAGYRPRARYRRGHPYTPMVSLWELDTWAVTPAERRWLQRELVVRTGQFVRMDPHDFVPVQEEALKQWAPLAERASSAPGGWGRPLLRF